MMKTEDLLSIFWSWNHESIGNPLHISEEQLNLLPFSAENLKSNLIIKLLLYLKTKVYVSEEILYILIEILGMKHFHYT